jgi:hypothetical protein
MLTYLIPEKNVHSSSTIACICQDYGDKIEEPPAKRKKREGPVRISIPTLRDLQKNLAEEEGIYV